MTNKLNLKSGLEKDMEESLYCPECLPSCSTSRYSVKTSSLPLFSSYGNKKGLISMVENVTEISIIRIFFARAESEMYKQDVSLTWYEICSKFNHRNFTKILVYKIVSILGNFGAMFGIVTGISIISVFEVLLFCSKEFIKGFKQLFEREESKNSIIILP